MKIQPYVQKLHSSSVYKTFQQKNQDAFLVAGFFVIDFETGNNLHQIDYYVPSKKKFAAFTLDKGVEVQLMNTLDKKTPSPLDLATRIDLDALKGIIQDEMKNRSITQSIKKMIAIIQTIEGKKVWNVNCVLSGMDLLRVHVEDASETVLKMEKSSLMDYVQRLPTPKEMNPKAPEASPQDIDKKIEQLDKLKELLKKEKVEIEKQAPAAAEAPQAVKKVAKAVKAAKATKKK